VNEDGFEKREENEEGLKKKRELGWIT